MPGGRRKGSKNRQGHKAGGSRKGSGRKSQTQKDIERGRQGSLADFFRPQQQQQQQQQEPGPEQKQEQEQEQEQQQPVDEEKEPANVEEEGAIKIHLAAILKAVKDAVKNHGKNWRKELQGRSVWSVFSVPQSRSPPLPLFTFFCAHTWTCMAVT